MMDAVVDLRSRRWLAVGIALVIVGLLAVPGCGAAPWVAQGLRGNEQRLQIKAQYTDLENRSVAVLVAADEYLLYAHPEAQLKVTRAISARIAANIEGVTLTPPQQMITFQRQNPYWTTIPYSQLIDRLGVERLIIIDLLEYRTREPGNAYVWHGVIAGEVGVVEADSDDPNNFAYSTTVRAAYPEETVIGLLESDDETVELGMLAMFARDAGGLFYDHEIVRKLR